MTHCPDHDKTWTGLGICHCHNGCGELFLTVKAFDAHRVGPDGNRRCDVRAKDEKGRLRLQKMPGGTWCMRQDENVAQKLSNYPRKGQSSVEVEE